MPPCRIPPCTRAERCSYDVPKPPRRAGPRKAKTSIGLNIFFRKHRKTARRSRAVSVQKIPSLACKPSSVVYGHLSGNAVAGELKRCSQLPPGEQPVRRQPNLAPDGVYTARGVSAAPVSSYLPFPSLQDEPAVCFCCTFLGVASTGRYPASCSAVLGLSSCPEKGTRPYGKLGIF